MVWDGLGLNTPGVVLEMFFKIMLPPNPFCAYMYDIFQKELCPLKRVLNSRLSYKLLLGNELVLESRLSV